MYPVNYFISSGLGISSASLVAFDAALLDAHLANYNLVKISSILPMRCKRSYSVSVKEGSPLLTAFGTITSSTVGETIASAIAVGIPANDDQVGVIMEYSGVTSKEEAENKVRKMVQAAMANHKIPYSEIISSSIEAHVEKNKFYSVISAIAIWQGVKNTKAKKIPWQFRCHSEKCTKSCCAEFDGISPFLTSAEGRSFTQIPLTPDDYSKIVEAGFIEYTVTTQDGNNFIRTEQNGTCKAWINGTCALYSVRPTVCKAFPLYIDMFSGLCVITDCDGVEYSPNSNKEWTSELEAAIKMYKYWISYYEQIYGIRKDDNIDLS